MPLHPATLGFLRFLGGNPAIRHQIRALPNQTLLYAGDRPSHFSSTLFAALRPESRPAATRRRNGEVTHGVWMRLEDSQDREPHLRGKQTLPQVLKTIAAPGTPHASLLQFAYHVHGQVPERPDQTILWRALSGIFASNATGAVSFELGSGIGAKKVLAVTEIPVLLRNPNIDATTREMLSYYQRCIARGEDNLVSLGHG